MTAKETYAEWKRLGGQIIDGDYVTPIHAQGTPERKALDELMKGAPAGFIEALLDGGLYEDLKANGLAG